MTQKPISIAAILNNEVSEDSWAESKNFPSLEGLKMWLDLERNHRTQVNITPGTRVDPIFGPWNVSIAWKSPQASIQVYSRRNKKDLTGIFLN